MYDIFSNETVNSRPATVIRGLGDLDLTDTFECGQAFRYELITREEGYVEYLTVTRDVLIRVGQRCRGELCFFDMTDEDIQTALDYFRADTDFREIRRSVSESTDSAWLREAAEMAKGIVILRQDPWEAVFSFIVSQNNNIPRIRKIIRALALAYGENLAVKHSLSECPIKKGCTPCHENCRECGICYSFPTPSAVLESPEAMNNARTGFRYKYLLDSASKVASGEVDLDDILDKGSYTYTLEKLKTIKGVGDKVASCAALFGFGNLEAFPIDVWMKRAIETYFDGKLDPATLGEYAGVAQQYIFHRIRNYGE